MRMKSRHWMIAAIMAIALHAGVAIGMFWQRADEGAQAPGIGGIEIALGPASSAPGAPDAAPETPAPDETAEPEPPEPPEPIAEPKPVEPEDISERVIEPALSEAIPEIVSEAAPATVSTVEPPAEHDPQTTGTGGKEGPEDSMEADGHNIAAGGRTGAVADYGAIVLAWLERHKDYPRRAQQRRQQGVVILFIAIDRDGRVLEARIKKSSGRDILDQAALDMLERADPLPPVPDDMPQERLEMVVPVQFFMT